MWLLAGKTLYFFTVLLSGSGSLSAGILVALSTNTGVKAAATERPSFSDVTQSQSYYADIESLAEQGWLS